MRKRSVKVAIIGVGYWGPNYARLCFEVEEADLVWFADVNRQALSKVHLRYPGVKTTVDYKQVLNDPEVEAVVVVTPAQTHFEIVKDALESNKHVLVEKPLTADLSEAEKIKKLVKKSGKVLVVDHIFKFNPAVIELRKLIKSGKLGKIYYLNSFYTALGPIRKDVDAMWDLAPHWVYTISYLLGSQPVSVRAEGGEFLKKGMNDVVFIYLKYPQKVLASIHASWLYPQKVRSMAVVGSKKMAFLDDASPDAKLIIYDKGAEYNSKDPNFADLQVIFRDGDVVIPKIERKEPLKEGFLHFLDCLSNNKKPIADVQDGLEVVKILAAAEDCLKKGKGVKKCL